MKFSVEETLKITSMGIVMKKKIMLQLKNMFMGNC